MAGTRPAATLLSLAHHGLTDATETTAPGERFALAHLAALRAAAAVLACRATPRKGRPRPVWALLTDVAPELGEWAAFFAAGAGKRAAAESGLAGVVTPREADDLLRDAEAFVAVVEKAVEKVVETTLATRLAG